MQKLRAAVDARALAGSDPARFTIVGRSDAREPLGLDEAIRRGAAYRAAGADVVFVEAPRDAEELRRIGAEVPGPLIANLFALNSFRPREASLGAAAFAHGPHQIRLHRRSGLVNVMAIETQAGFQPQ